MAKNSAAKAAPKNIAKQRKAGKDAANKFIEVRAAGVDRKQISSFLTALKYKAKNAKEKHTGSAAFRGVEIILQYDCSV